MAQNATTVLYEGRKVLYEVQDSVTRPDDTSAYAVGDAISDNATTATAAGAFTFAFGTGNGRGIYFTDFTIHNTVVNVTAADFELLIFDALPAVAGWKDNGAVAITDAEFLTCKCVVPIAASNFKDVKTGKIQTILWECGVVMAPTSSTLYGILVANGTYTPASQEVFTITAHAIID